MDIDFFRLQHTTATSTYCMCKRKVGNIHVSHPAPKRARIHHYTDSDVSEIATAIMFDMCTNLPTEYRPRTAVQIYDGIKQYIDGIKTELVYDDIPFCDLTAANFEQAGTTIGWEADRAGIFEIRAIFYAVARQAIIVIQKGREADARRRRYDLRPPSDCMAENVGRVMAVIELRNRTPPRKILSEYEIWDRVGATRERPTETELADFGFACFDDYVAFYRKFWCNEIDFLTPDIARSLIGKDVYVIVQSDLKIGDFDVVRQKMTIVNPMKILNEVSPSVFEVRFRSLNMLIYARFRDNVLLFDDEIPFYIFIHGPHTPQCVNRQCISTSCVCYPK